MSSRDIDLKRIPFDISHFPNHCRAARSLQAECALKNDQVVERGGESDKEEDRARKRERERGPESDKERDKEGTKD